MAGKYELSLWGITLRGITRRGGGAEGAEYHVLGERRALGGIAALAVATRWGHHAEVAEVTSISHFRTEKLSYDILGHTDFPCKSGLFGDCFSSSFSSSFSPTFSPSLCSAFGPFCFIDGIRVPVCLQGFVVCLLVFIVKCGVLRHLSQFPENRVFPECLWYCFHLLHVFFNLCKGNEKI